MITNSRPLPRLLLLATGLFSIILVGCRTSSANSQALPQQPASGTIVTVLVDFSASFAPLTATDAVALRSVATAVGTKTTQEWSGPTKVLLRKVGTSSVLNPLLCKPITHQPSLTGPGNDNESFRKELNACVESTLAASFSNTKRERYTDISGAVEMSAQSAQSDPAAKFLVVLSDFLEQQAPQAHAATLHLNQERVILIHRPGLDDKSIESHINRLDEWRRVLLAAGAKSVAVIPEEWATSGVLEQKLNNSSKGTVGIVILDPNAIAVLRSEELRRDRLQEVALAVAERAAEWAQPVTILWYVSPSTPASISWMPALEYQPLLIEKAGEINNIDQLKRIMRESAIGALRFCNPSSSPADLAAQLRLLHAPDVIGNRETKLFLISSFDATLPNSPPSLWTMRDEMVSMMYTPLPSDGADPNRLFARLGRWKSRLASLGAAEVCTFELLSLSPAALKACVSRGGAL
jgi:hypothetical protein